MNAHLDELSANIQIKEELISQLSSSREKYHVMRQFYEDKLQTASNLLQAASDEKETLLCDIMEAQNSEAKQQLEGQLSKKENLIKKLSREKNELYKLTKIEKRNESHVAKLAVELEQMKRYRADLQKRIGEERKHNRTVLHQARRELDKGRHAQHLLKLDLAKQTQESDKLKRINKQRLDEVNSTRRKYREAEKNLRMQTLKKGVLSRAGLDNILLGGNINNSKGSNSNGNPSSTSAVRDWLNLRIGDVETKEKNADILAHEWEERMELMEQREQVRARSTAWLAHCRWRSLLAPFFAISLSLRPRQHP